jgi:hypothetical protein
MEIYMSMEMTGGEGSPGRSVSGFVTSGSTGQGQGEAIGQYSEDKGPDDVRSLVR